MVIEKVDSINNIWENKMKEYSNTSRWYCAVYWTFLQKLTFYVQRYVHRWRIKHTIWALFINLKKNFFQSVQNNMIWRTKDAKKSFCLLALRWWCYVDHLLKLFRSYQIVYFVSYWTYICFSFCHHFFLFFLNKDKI